MSKTSRVLGLLFVVAFVLALFYTVWGVFFGGAILLPFAVLLGLFNTAMIAVVWNFSSQLFDLIKTSVVKNQQALYLTPDTSPN